MERDGLARAEHVRARPSRDHPSLFPQLHFQIPGAAPLTLRPDTVAIAGYTGRDQESVRRHVAELAEQGIAPPPSVPMVYVVTPDRLTQADTIHVTGAHTTGE